MPEGYTHLNIDFEDDNGLSAGEVFAWPDSGGITQGGQRFGVNFFTMDGARAFTPTGGLTCTISLQLEARTEASSLSDVELHGIIHAFKAVL